MSYLYLTGLGRWQFKDRLASVRAQFMMHHRHAPAVTGSHAPAVEHTPWNAGPTAGIQPSI